MFCIEILASTSSEGARLAVGVDTDALAVRAASQNGVLNKFSGKWITLQCQPTVDGPDPLDSNPQGFVLPTEYDLCVANILQVLLLLPEGNLVTHQTKETLSCV